jgi:hypothetical protein
MLSIIVGADVLVSDVVGGNAWTHSYEFGEGLICSAVIVACDLASPSSEKIEALNN